MKKVALIMGSKSDWPVVKKALNRLDSLQLEYEVHVYSAHRTPEKVSEFALSASENGFGVIIAAAGMAAHLAGVIASKTVLPVIGLPLKSASLDGIDALLSTVQMPPGIPVATVGIDAADNAALLAAEILALEDKSLTTKLEELRIENAKKVLADDSNLISQEEKDG